MSLTTADGKKYFADFEIEFIVPKRIFSNGALQEGFDSAQIEQIKIFGLLENDVQLIDGTSFGGQVHFQNAYRTPVQRWFPYREGYSTRLVEAFLKELHVTGNVFDPFSGSGTTLLTARFNNLSSFGIDVNPISVLVAKVENEKYEDQDISEIHTEIGIIQSAVKSDVTFFTSFELSSKIFNSEILQSLLQFKSHIKQISNIKIKNLFFVAWLSIIEEVSNIKKEGNGIKYKNRRRTPNGYINIDKEEWEKKTFPEDKFVFIKTKLVNHLKVILLDIKNHYGSCEKIPKIFQGSCLNIDNFFSDEIQFTFFSPPYCNCFDYFEIHKVDLWLGDFVTNKEEFRLLRNTGFRSNTNSLNHKPIIYQNHNLEKLIGLFNNEKLWNARIPSVVKGYFDDMYHLLTKIFQQTTHGGYVGIVVGSSAYSGVIIPSDLLIADIAKEIGFKVKSVIITRHLTTSSQQKQGLEKLKNYLRESIVLLQK